MAKASSGGPKVAADRRRPRWRAVVLAVVVPILAACQGLTATPAPTPTSSPTPTPVVQPAKPAVVSACSGKAVPGADFYEGSTHPLVIVESEIVSTAHEINARYLNGEWKSPLQIVICVAAHKWVRIKDCGTVTRLYKLGSGNVSGGVEARGRLYLLQDTQQVRVVVAQTGKTLVTKSFYGAKLTCQQAQNSSEDQSLFGPWSIGAEIAGDGQIDAYAESVMGEAEE